MVWKSKTGFLSHPNFIEIFHFQKGTAILFIVFKNDPSLEWRLTNTKLSVDFSQLTPPLVVGEIKHELV